MDGVKRIWEGNLTLQRKSKNDERHIQLYDSGVLVRWNKQFNNVKEIMVVLYAPEPKKPKDEVDDSKEKTVLFIDA